MSIIRPACELKEIGCNAATIVFRFIVITGANTGSGKTVLTSLLARHLRGAGAKVAALKPICSGGRDDAKQIRSAAKSGLTLDQVNPWHFRAALAPVLSARKEGRAVTLREVVTQVRTVAHDYEPVLVEGAGGLLSPLGEHFSTRELIAALGADVIIAAQNELGAVNHVRLTIEALPPLLRMRAKVCLMNPAKPNAASRTNAALLAEFIAEEHVVQLPRFSSSELMPDGVLPKDIPERLASLLLHG